MVIYKKIQIHPRRFFRRVCRFLTGESTIFDVKMKVNGFIFKDKSFKPKFYVPFYKVDCIQSMIVNNRNYFEGDNLDMVCKKWHGGIIGDIISDKSVLDIGANIGNHTLYYLFECNAKYIHCFEPVDSTYAMLKRNIEINHVESRTKLYNVGVGASECTGVIDQYDTTNIGSTVIRKEENGSIHIVSIDELKLEEEIGLIKIDVEGFEVDVIKGLLSTLIKNHPFITIEIRDRNFEEVNTILSSIGYVYEEITHDIGKGFNDYLYFIG